MKTLRGICLPAILLIVGLVFVWYQPVFADEGEQEQEKNKKTQVQRLAHKTKKGGEWTNGPLPLIWESTYTKTPPTIDGKLDDLWQTTKPVTVIVREAMGGDRPTQVVLRAVHSDDAFYLIAHWPDDTKSDMRDPYVWNKEKKDYERPSKPDDQFALEFPITGNFDINMLTLANEYTADVWHWKAGRGNLIGCVDDKRHIISQEPIPYGKEYSMGGHGKVYVARIADEGQSSYYLKPKPARFEGDLVNSFEHRQPTHSMADVRGKAVHNGKAWTLEMSRKFNTGNADDAVIDPGRDNICAIAVLNDELYWRHSVSTAIALRFAGGPTNKTQALWNFDGSNEIPPRWKVAETRGRGKPATWEVISDISAPSQSNVVAITVNENYGNTFNLLLAEETKYKDLKVEVMVKAISGKEDQGGGPIWRAKDADNYYIARWNPLEDNFRVYYVKGGRRIQLGSANVKADPKVWHEIRIVHRATHITAYFNGKKMIELEDSTFGGPGMVGLWVKADGRTAFDDFSPRHISSD